MANSAPVFTDAGEIEIASTDNAGTQGNAWSQSPVFSPDGTKLAFWSSATNLISGDTNGVSDVFIKDLVTGAITRVSTGFGESQGNNASSDPVFSPDGTKLAFSSLASDLVPGDTNWTPDIFIKDLATGAITRISTDAAGGQQDGHSYGQLAFSPDGSMLAFYSDSTNLVTGDANGVGDLFVKNLATGEARLVTVGAGGAQANGESYDPVFSPDGTKVLFYSNASNLVEGDTNGNSDVFLKDLVTGSVSRVSTDGVGQQGNYASFRAAFSPDGSKVVFWSAADNLVPGDINHNSDIFVKDLATGAITLVSTNEGGEQANNTSDRPVFSSDGTKVAFWSFATNLVPDDTNGTGEIFVKDLLTGAVTRVSTSATGEQGNGFTYSPPVFSPDGSKIAFWSSATNLVPGDTNGTADIFVKEILPPSDFAATVTDVAGASMLTASGSAFFSDPDAGDTHTVAVVPQPGALGSLTAIVVPVPDGSDRIDWTFSVEAGQLEALGSGETRTTTFTLVVDDGQGGTANQDITVTLGGIADAPVLTIPATASFAENGTGVVLSASATDPDGNSVAFSLGGTDAALFDIGANGELRFKAPPDFEAPADAGGDNVYDLIVQASDGHGGVDAQGVAVTVTNVSGLVVGDAFDNVLPGTAEEDTIRGLGGNDLLQGGAGGDVLEGGAGFDIADYQNAETGIIVDLVNPVNNTGEAAGDSFNSVEGIQGSAFDDSLRGNGTANRLLGGDGNDSLRGRGGADALDGGAGIDMADYRSSSIGIVVDLNNPGNNTGDAAGDTFISVEGVHGSDFDDALTGDRNDNILEGGPGSDLFVGGKGHDTMDGGSGIDTLDYGAEALLPREQGDLPPQGVYVNLLGRDQYEQPLRGPDGNIMDLDTAIDTFGDRDEIPNIPNVIGTGQNDAIYGGNHDNRLQGGGGDDILLGGGRDDTLEGGTGTDTAIYRGNRSDYLVVSNADGSVTITDLRPDPVDPIANVRNDGTDTVRDVEFFQFANVTVGLAGLLSPVNLPPTGTVTISGTAELGETLTASNTLADADGLGAISYQWLRDGVAVGDGATYLLTAADVGHAMTAVASYTDALGFSESVTSAATATVGDGNDAPDALVLSGGIVPENAADGTQVGTLQGHDLDIGDTLSYSLLDNAGGRFTVDAATGVISVASGALLDYEITQSYQITARVSDASGAHFDRSFAIAVTDLNEAPTSLVLTGGTVAENAPAGALIGTLTAIDPDAGDNLTFALSDDAGGLFTLVGNEIRVAPGAVLDFESSSTHSITVQVIDAGGLSRTQTTTIGVLNVDEAPTAILMVGGQVAERSPAGTVVATLDAVDPDGSSAFSFALLDDAGGRFEIIGSEVRVAAGAVLDFDVQNTHQVTVEVTDPTGLTFTQSFSLNVTNVADPPTDIIVTGGVVIENAVGGTVVATLDALGRDVGETFTFTIANDPSGFFEIVGREVRVAAGARIDFETQAEHTITLRATDSSGASFDEDLTINVEDAGNVIIGNNSANPLTGSVDEDEIFGRGGNDTLSGLGGDDQLYGENGNDRLIGGSGADRLVGGLNNDTYVLADADDATNDTIVEDVGQGTDTVEVSETYRLGANLENLILTGTKDVQGFGNELNNSITGNAGNNLIDGGLGNDSMAGGLGNDVYYVDAAADRVVEASGAGIDEIRTGLETYSLAGRGNIENLTYTGTGNFSGTGNERANVITGASGADTLYGGGGADTLIGGAGNDTYIVNDAGDLVIEQAGQGDADTVHSSATYTLVNDVENLLLTGGRGIDGIGNALDNAITGNTGSNKLDGGAGADVLSGGSGNDTYVIDDVGDVVIEVATQGTDTVQTNLLTYGLETFANVENLAFVGVGDFAGRGNELANTISGGAGNDILEGNAGNDSLVGGSGNDRLVGGVGDDSMRGGAGDDTYLIDSSLDRAIESQNEGIDTVIASVDFTLGSNVENLTLTGTGVSGTGNGLANVITGTEGANTLRGGGGNDRLIGGGGSDMLTGGSGGDVFVFALGFGNDTVTDFDANPTGGQDFLDVSSLGITAGNFTDRVTITDVGADTLVTIDGNPAQSIRLSGIGNSTTVTQQDFWLLV